MSYHHRAPFRTGHRPAMPTRRPWSSAGLAVLLAITAAGCTTPRADIPAIGEVEADRLLFERGAAALDENDWRRARQYFVEIRDNYPQSQYRAPARLGIGESYEQEGSTEAYVRALAEFQDFLSLYPTHPRAPFAQYKLGMVHFHQMRRAERDQTETRNAIREFENFLDRYPTDAEWTSTVRARLREARDRLSEHDFTVGHFYYRAKFYPGAVNRFRQILDNDPEYSKRDAVYFYLGESYAVGQAIAEAIPYFARILEEFEASEYADEARVRISELEPLLDR
ncbi:MAG: outer membrane protein assembly factor BamD [Acidobacteria bacterium]|nr:outer membrane protein assembly factor BamD [Acidobacteriota bacterium]